MSSINLQEIKEENEAFLFAFDPDQARDERGQWTSGGGGGGGGGSGGKSDSNAATQGAKGSPITDRAGNALPHDATLDEIKSSGNDGIVSDIEEAQNLSVAAENLIEDMDGRTLSKSDADEITDFLMDADAALEAVTDYDMLLTNRTAEDLAGNASGLNHLLKQAGYDPVEASHFTAEKSSRFAVRNAAFLRDNA